MLFLAGGRYSLRRDPVSTACLLLTLAPRFPNRTVDNQYHLQALRHLYIIAAENRVLHTVDVDSGIPVNLDVQVDLLDGRTQLLSAPGLLPEQATVRSVHVLGVESSSKRKLYFETTIDFADSGDGRGSAGKTDSAFVRKLVRSSSVIKTLYVKRRILEDANSGQTTMTNAKVVQAIRSTRPDRLAADTTDAGAGTASHRHSHAHHLHTLTNDSTAIHHEFVLHELLSLLLSFNNNGNESNSPSSSNEGLKGVLLRCPLMLDMLQRSVAEL